MNNTSCNKLEKGKFTINRFLNENSEENAAKNIKSKSNKKSKIKSNNSIHITNNIKKYFKKTSENIKIFEQKKAKMNKKIVLYIIILVLIVAILPLIIYLSYSILPTQVFDISRNIKIKIHRLLGVKNNYNSFSQKKSSNYCHYFVDAKDYYEDLFQNLMDAKDSIFITDFWFSPELFLRRPVEENIYKEMARQNILTKDFGKNISRIMDILDYKAKQGLKIYLLIYYEWSISLPVYSKYAEKVLNEINDNITVIRFPANQNVILWANHEKLVIIDKIIGYVGGFDLCWGRYDNKKHAISEEQNKDNVYEFPFYDYANERIKEFTNADNYLKPLISRINTPRLPWHDVHCRIIGPSVVDITKHFTERWNFAITSELKEQGVIPNIKNIAEYKNNLNIWEKIKLYFSTKKKKSSAQADNILEIDDNINKKLEKDIYKKYQKIGGVSSDVQVLRSVSDWNLDTKKTEDSILKAYYDLIENSEHYIFIENQYFISKAWTNEERQKKNKNFRDIVKNEIALYIRRRVEKAYEKNENFKVYIIMPLLPDFSGEVEESQTIKTILKYTYRTIISNNGLSLIEQLENKMGDKWKDYICFYSLRNHGVIKGIPKTEMIYVHSKLLIVDDRQVILGSANINDRSMLGNRDSEVDVLIEEQKEDYFLMNGDNEYKAAKFAVGLRKRLMAEYLGIDIYDDILDDPVSDKLFKYMSNRAKKNTELYHEIFGCYPDDKYTSYQLLKKAKKEKEEELPEELVEKYMKYKDGIVGYITEFPLFFLKDENLGQISSFSLQDLLPENTYT